MPLSSREMRAHLQPCCKINVNSSRSSSEVQSAFLMLGLRWLIHISLQSWKDLKYFPADRLYSSKETTFHSCDLLKFLCDWCLTSRFIWRDFLLLRTIMSFSSSSWSNLGVGTWWSLSFFSWRCFAGTRSPLLSMSYWKLRRIRCRGFFGGREALKPSWRSWVLRNKISRNSGYRTQSCHFQLCFFIFYWFWWHCPSKSTNLKTEL